ncbi:chemotaxis protein [Aliivibrio sp. S3MY1]|uniref:chemotaxis protein n=1 Tax=unclassified Aliivibrio TaxID=2645654 RepID=UPI002379DD5C|nr:MULTISPECIES: chemotaxis protein [unclassified Aliivibrio]MDD9196459.1 chemotaxis protein [Aliivibrio sp. S3MY1]MDD9199144.1 chemotaxis protein [Aliivibrio sp. S2MY1]
MKYTSKLFASKIFSIALSLSLLNGCSLLELKIESQAVPLTTVELNTRILTREYSKLFFSEVESAADEIAATYPKDDTLHQSYVLLWKIHAEEGLQRAAYQVSPKVALIDSWVFAAQMEQFFSPEGKGSELFDGDIAFKTSQVLNEDIKNIAEKLLSSSEFSAGQDFIVGFVADHPFDNLMMRRTPALKAWLAHQNIDETEAVATLGTMPEALGDVSDRLGLVSEQTPKIMTWKAQLIAMNSNVNANDINKMLESVRHTSESFQDFVKNNPEYMQNLAEQMSLQLQPLLDDLDLKTDDKLNQLSAERIALEAMVARERQELVNMIERERNAIAIIVSQEREKFTQDLDKVSQDVLTLAVDKIIDLIKSTIIYFILFILTIFFAPLGLGYFLGKRAAIKKTVV